MASRSVGEEQPSGRVGVLKRFVKKLDFISLTYSGKNPRVRVMRVQFEVNKRKCAPTLADSLSAAKFTDWIGRESESSVAYRVVDATPREDCAKGGEGLSGA